MASSSATSSVRRITTADHHVKFQDIVAFAITGIKKHNNNANSLLIEDSPRAEIPRTDAKEHNESRIGFGPGTYPSNYEVCRLGEVDFDSS